MQPEKFPFPFGYWTGKVPQEPAAGPFNSDDIKWICNEAMVPASRIDDFLEGEGKRPKTSCRFTRRKADDPNMISGKKTVRFWCCFGPKDLRDKIVHQLPVPQAKKGKGSRPRAASRSLGTSQHRGCQAHFNAHFFSVRVDVVVLKWVQRAHIDKKGRACHGVEDPTSALGNALTFPRLSPKCRDVVERLLRTGMQPVDVILEHQKTLTALCDSNHKDSMWPRDAQLCLKDVWNIQARLRKVLHADDAVSSEMWVEQHKESVIFHQRKCEAENKPFILAVATPWMIKKLAELGHNNAIAFDATFGSNCYGYSLFTVVCFDEVQNEVPCCWVVTERQQAKDVEIILSHVREQATATRRDCLKLPGVWFPSCIIVDDSKEEQLAISHVFPGLPVLLCLWHVRRSWIKELHAKVSNPIVKAEMNRSLGTIMYASEDAQGLSEQFIRKFSQETKFMDYYIQHWHPQLQKWAKQYRDFKHNNQNINGAIERWHRTLKVHLRASRKGRPNRRVSWLLHILVDVIENYYWCLASLKQQGHIRNSIVHKLLLSAIENARTIPDEHVSVHVIDGKNCAFVRSQNKPWQQHEVTSFDSDAASCTCSQGAQGSICKHQIKCLLKNGYSDMAVLQRLETFAGTINEGLNVLTATENSADVLDNGNEGGDTGVGDGHISSPPHSIADLPVATMVETKMKTMTEEDAVSLVRRIWTKVGSSDCLAARAFTLLQDVHERIADLAPRNSVREAGVVFTEVETFVELPGTNRSLKRHPDFVDGSLSKGRRRIFPPTSAGLPAVSDIENFSSTQQSPVSMQAALDKTALQATDFNIHPEQCREVQLPIVKRECK
ncbi:hypothetical protein R1sor_003963 [Riccia sorocarpa]|uniref:SWIM-type domain-containing protein n=1 Tax=Riccia sorocarpa TaxID=122646 RepID=A0ABD3H506_9MARC